MATSQTILMTGATSGLGLNTVQHLSQLLDVNLIAGARHPEEAYHLQSAMPEERLTILPLDLASLESVRQFAAMAIDRLGGRQITAIALNAGIQVMKGLERTKYGYERTFASNHLGHFLLVGLLLPVLAQESVVISTASGTHDPTDLLSGQFGFRGGFFPSAEAIASGTLDDSVSLKQQCLDRYATSKLCNLLFTYDMSHRVSPDRARFLAFDPGLMPGTSLARDRSAVERFAWHYILPILRWFVPGVSSPRRSARTLARLLTEPAIAPISGQHFDYRLRETKTSDDSHRQDLQHELYAISMRLCGAESKEFQGTS
jgi:NAD(P)-dependent dehydrogenase (short-subunit alcohol dehydrogenase family)